MPGGYNAGSVYAEASLDISKFKAAAAEMGGDSAKIASAMEKAAAGLEKAQSSLEQLSAGYDAAKSSAAAAEAVFSTSASVLEEMNIKAEQAAIKAAALGNALEQAQAKFGEHSMQAHEASSAYDEAAAEADKLGAAVEKQETVVAKNKAAFDRAAASVKKYESRISATEDKIDGFNSTLSDLNTQLTSGMMDSAASDMDSASLASEAFQDILKNVSDKGLKGLGSALQSAAGRLDLFKNSSGIAGTALTAVQRAITPVVTGLSASTVGFLAAGAAAAYGAYKFIDYASGAAAAREAQEKLNETAQEWADTNITTSYEKSEGMKGYGLSEKDFAPSTKSSKDWLNTVTKVWSDGKKETNDIVKEMVSGFTTGSDEMRTSLTELQQSAQKAGVSDKGLFGDLDADLTRLDAIDKEVEALLKKKQNSNLTDADIANLQSLYDERGAIQVKYKLAEDGTAGFDQITQNVQAAISRGAEGGTVWADAFASATQGVQAYTDSLNAEYDAQYKTISLMENGAEKATALAQLQAWYNEQSVAGTQAYGQALADAAKETGAFEKNGAYADQMDKLTTALEAMYTAAENPSNENMAAFSTALSELDETQVVEMTAALTSMDAAGVTLSTGMSDALTAITNLKNALDSDVFKNNDDLFASLNQMFGENLENEILEINASLNTETLDAVFNAWAAGEHADIIPKIDTTTIDVSQLENLEGTVTAIHQGKNVSVDLSTLDELRGTVTVIDDNGNATTVSISSLSDLTGTVTTYNEGEKISFSASALSQLDGTVTTIAVSPDAEKEVIQLDGEITVRKVNIEGGEFSNAKDAFLEYNGGKGVTSNRTTEKNLAGNRTALVTPADADVVINYANALDALAKAQAEFANVPMTSPDYESQQQNIQSLQTSVDEWGTSIQQMITATGDWNAAAAYIANGLQLLSDSENNLSEEDAAALQQYINGLLSVMESTDLTGAGSDVAAGLGEGLRQYGWDTDASTVAQMLSSAIDAAVGRGSPAELTKPTGSDVAAGLGVGMQQYSFDGDTAAVAALIQSSMSSSLSPSEMQSIGKNFSAGLASGILAGRSGVIRAAIEVAKAAAAAAKAALDIHSPSGVTEGFGEYFDLGFVKGIRNEMPEIDSAVKDALQLKAPSSIRYAQIAPDAGPQSVASFDFDRLETILQQMQFAFNVNGRRLADAMANDTAFAQNARNRRNALKFGTR